MKILRAFTSRTVAPVRNVYKVYRGGRAQIPAAGELSLRRLHGGDPREDRRGIDGDGKKQIQRPAAVHSATDRAFGHIAVELSGAGVYPAMSTAPAARRGLSPRRKRKIKKETDLQSVSFLLRGAHSRCEGISSFDKDFLKSDCV